MQLALGSYVGRWAGISASLGWANDGVHLLCQVLPQDVLGARDAQSCRHGFCVERRL